MMTTSNLLGFFAASLMLLTFIMKDVRRLRTVAIFTNIAFIAYGAAAWLPPVLCLHIALLPVNLLRLKEVLNTKSECGNRIARRAVAVPS
jgi:hypothetical protein